MTPKMIDGIAHWGKDKPYQGPEDELQKSSARWLSYMKPKPLFFHVPNGGRRNAREAAKFKLMGVLPGVSDLIILEKKGNDSGLIIELKAKKGKLEKSQYDFLIMSYTKGFAVAVCWNLEAVMHVTKKYFEQ